MIKTFTTKPLILHQEIDHLFRCPRLATDVGSRIGVYFTVDDDNSAYIHFLVNGIDQGPIARSVITECIVVILKMLIEGRRRKVFKREK